ncbi:MAG: endonuclease NucS [archaeon]
MQEYIAKLREVLNTKQTIILSANCSIDYSGRAESYLPAGDRLIIIKPDRNLLIHQPNGNTPVNYMKADSEHSIIMEEDPVLKSTNKSQKEEIQIRLHKIYFLHTQFMNDNEKIMLKGTERDMAEKIYNNPELIEEGFKPLSLEEHTKYGFIDVFGYDKNNTLVVVECKRYCGDLKAVTQLRRYVEKIKKMKGVERVRGVLACPKVSPNAKHMLEDWGFKFVKVNPPKYLEKDQKRQRKIDDFSKK